MDTHTEATPGTGEAGVRVQRRAVLNGLWAAPAALALARWSHGRQEGAAPGPIDEFLGEWSERAAALTAAEEPNEDAQLHELCAALSRLAPASFPPRAMNAFEGDGMTTGPVHHAAPFLVLEVELDPGAVIRAHNHVGWNFASLCVEGEASVRHFELDGEAPEPGVLEREFTVREVSSALLTPGRTSTLTRTRANMHWFRAGEAGAKLLDFGIQFSDPGGGPTTFSVLEYDAEPRDRERRTHTARWLGNIYK
jgi:predicted metal-dependent enzyme (double-stranded beta helix superfamily)